jgi:integrase
MCTLIGLLACTGLRASEALGLTLDDLKLDLDPPHILIRNTKFYKSRFVPIHPTTTEKLRLYLQMRKQLCPSSSSKAVFLKDTGEPLRYHNALANFRAITHQAGIQSTAGRRQPALHALRHTFAVARLVSWHYAGLDARTLLPHLSVYLGHVSLEETYWYLTATPELLTAASASFESHVDSGGPNE